MSCTFILATIIHVNVVAKLAILRKILIYAANKDRIILTSVDQDNGVARRLSGAKVGHGYSGRDNVTVFVLGSPLDAAAEWLSRYGADCLVISIGDIKRHENVTFLEHEGVCVVADQRVGLHLRQAVQRFGKRPAQVVTESQFGYEIAAFQTIDALVIVDCMVECTLVDNLGHNHVKGDKCQNQTYQIECRRCLEAPRHADDIVEYLAHDRDTNQVMLFLNNY